MVGAWEYAFDAELRAQAARLIPSSRRDSAIILAFWEIEGGCAPEGCSLVLVADLSGT